MLTAGGAMTAEIIEPISGLILHWKDEYKVGIPHFDQQHQRLLRLVAFMAAAVAQKDNVEIVKALLLDVASYCEVHCADEERFMEELGYPEIESHRAEHKMFRDQVRMFLAEDGDGKTIGIRVMRMMQSWLKGHLLECDRRYAEYFCSLGLQQEFGERLLSGPEGQLHHCFEEELIEDATEDSER
jgi:hemerythrin